MTGRGTGSKTEVIIPAAGSGVRLGAALPKALVPLNGRPLIAYALRIFEESPLVDGVIVAVPAEHMNAFDEVIRAEGLRKVKSIVEGGATRVISVRHALDCLDDDTAIVAVHDAARPLLTRSLLERAIRHAETDGAVIAAVAVKPTIKRVNPRDFTVVETLDRSSLWEVQTPQVFRRDLLVRAHQDIADPQATDDAALVERLGEKVKIIDGDYANIKVTTPEDVAVAEALLAARTRG